MSKDQYTVHDDPTMKPKTIDISLKFKDSRFSTQLTNQPYSCLSAREYVDEVVRERETLYMKRVESVEYWVNVKADK